MGSLLEIPRQEVREIGKFGKNVVVDIDLLRHPAKDPQTGDLTEQGKRDFLDKLNTEYDPSFTIYKFYLSPHKRPQQLKETLQSFLEKKGISTTIRNKDKLLSYMQGLTLQTQAAILGELVARGVLSEEDSQYIREKNKDIPAYEPATRAFEEAGNRMLIEEFFEQNFPNSEFSGRDIGQDIARLVQHFRVLTSRLHSGSKVKIILIGHSGVIEHFLKLMYIQRHPEVLSKTVDVARMGGLLEPMEGPNIIITSNSSGKQTAQLKFRGQEIDL